MGPMLRQKTSEMIAWARNHDRGTLRLLHNPDYRRGGLAGFIVGAVVGTLIAGFLGYYLWGVVGGIIGGVVGVSG